MNDNHLLKEILEQPQALRRLHAAYMGEEKEKLNSAAGLLCRADLIHLAGMVTSRYGAHPAAIRLNRAAKPSIVHNASELLHYDLPSVLPGSCLVAISQSGESVEITRLLQALDGRIPIIGIHNAPESYLATHCDLGLYIHAGPQMACGSKTNLSTLAAMLMLAGAALDQDVQRDGQRLLAVADSIERFLDGWPQKVEPLVDFLQGAPYTVFLGRGPGLAAALFSACLFREVPKVAAEAMGAADFRHGMNEMIRPEHRVVVFAPAGPTRDLCLSLAQDMAALQVPVLLVTNREVDLQAEDVLLLLVTEEHDETWAPLLDMVPLQLAGYLLAQRQGHVPGELTIASYITRVE